MPEGEGASGDWVDDFQAKHLLRQVGILGSNGSGKTVMAKVILEECALIGIPSIIIDVQGDLARLAMEPEADENADPERQRAWSESTDVRVWTPLTSDGLPICIDPFNLPQDVPEDNPEEFLRMALDRLASGLTSLLGHDPNKPKGRQAKAFLFKHISTLIEAGEEPYDFGELAESIRAVDPEEFDMITPAALKEMARNAEANNTGADGLLYSLGTPLDIGVMMSQREPGRTPVNVLYLNTLPSDAMKHAFVQQLCRKLYDWMLANPSPDRLQCVMFLDEAGPFIPPDPHRPPAKDGLRLLLKQGRKFGLCGMIASQSPGDLDYRTMGQARSMFLGSFTQKQEISKIEPMLQQAKDPKAITANLPSLKAGQFELFSPDFSEEVVHLSTRWLLTPHGSPLTNEDLGPLIPDSLREWAAGFIRRRPRRTRVPSWRRGGVEEERVELPHSIPTLKSANDPMEVLLATTNALAIATLFVATYFLSHSYIDGELGIAWVAVGGAISVLLAVLLAMSHFLQDDWELAAKVRSRARAFEWVVLAWIWAVWSIHRLDWVDLGWAYYLVMVSQTLVTVFMALEYLHRIRLGRVSFGGESLLDRLRSVGAVLTEAEISSAQASSDELMRRFGLLTTALTVSLISALLWTGSDLSTGLLREAAVRLVTLEGAVLVANLVSIWKRR